ncbi:MAG: cytochrome P450 [Caulobacterales bacterium]|nr:cytochrome P450 [Caulobacterales bacterium]
MDGNAAPKVGAEVWSLPLETLDPSQAGLFQSGAHHEWFRRLRQDAPVHYTPQSAFGPYWSITRFDDIVAVDTNHEAFSSDRDIVIGDNPAGFAPPMFIAMDPPRHDQQRKVVSPAVAPRRLADLEVLIRQRVGAILDELPVGETFNWVDRVSIELTTQMLATLFDFPWEDRRLLPYWSDVTTASETVGVPADMAERERVLGECLAYFTRLWRERAAQPAKFDFISLLAHDPQTAGMVDNPMEFLGNLMLLIVGGNDTTRNSITGGVLALNLFPAEYDKLKADPSLVPAMVPEIIRWQTPLAHMRRTASRDVEFGGKTIRKGERVVMWYVSGNRDETVIAEPELFQIDRDRPRHHLSFGFGIHRCMGNRVAELQLKIVWEEILKRFRHVEVVGQPVRVLSNFVQGYSDLPVRLHA